MSGWTGSAVAEPRLTVFAAASLKTALDEVVQRWDGEVALSYGGSGTIADLVILANPDWMSWLEDQGALSAAPVPLLGNRLVVIGSAGALPLDPAQLGAQLGEKERLAIGQTQSVPAGIYGRQWLQSVGLWDELSLRLAETENVRAALALVARGETPFGIVYASDAVAEPKVEVVYDVPDHMHTAISYPVAVVAAGQAEAAATFLAFVMQPDTMLVFLRNGFRPPPEAN